MVRKKQSQIEHEAIIFISCEVTQIDYINEEQKTGRKKTVFWIDNANRSRRTMCIYWDIANITQGDIINIKGRFSNDSFIVWDYQIVNRQEKGA